ncbi:MAG TPA: hypothetical protein VMU67_05540 [Steroidobacteraceae bacterium]|nr:hypothetical protein [Steroidobacteraceae bacterium]
MAQRIVQVGIGPLEPLAPLGGEVRVAQMPRGNLGAGESAAAHIELDDRIAHRIGQRAAIALDESARHVIGAEPPAFEREKCHLLGRVEAAQIRIEL